MCVIRPPIAPSQLFFSFNLLKICLQAELKGRVSSGACDKITQLPLADATRAVEGKFWPSDEESDVLETHEKDLDWGLFYSLQSQCRAETVSV